MTRIRKCFSVVGVLLAAAVAARADWNPGDPHKMHYPQLPNPNGWDVDLTNPMSIADDWRCSETGPVTDIHFWGSWQHDRVGEILGVKVSIHDKFLRTMPDGTVRSVPGPQLWPPPDADGVFRKHVFLPADFTTRLYGTGQQGWYDPQDNIYAPNDHFTYYQINIENILNPFIQQFNSVYWLNLSVNVAPPPVGQQPYFFGWKTTFPTMHFREDAVWGKKHPDGSPPGFEEWTHLVDPITQQTLDMAFVITPAPSTLALLTIAGLLVARRRRS